MHKNIKKRYISINIKTISISLSSLQQHATTEEKERERESTTGGRAFVVSFCTSS